MSTLSGEPSAIEKSVTVRLSPDAAFELFTDGLRRWWPRATHSVLGGADAALVFGKAVGDAVVEIGSDGRRHPWGTIVEWDPPRGFAMSWHPGRPSDEATRLRVCFVAVAEGTRVRLRHDGWGARADAAAARDRYERGWDAPLAAFAAQAPQGAA
jgi:uncharacterized protein YndB with AHSA1/START domain